MEVWRKIDTRALLKDLKRLRINLTRNGPTSAWEDEKRFLFRCVDTYKAILKADDIVPAFSVRMPEFKLSSPATKLERARITEAADLKKQLLRKLREMRS